MFYPNLREEELKNKVAQTYFPDLDCTTIIGNIDFCVKPPVEYGDPALLFEQPAFLWAEAKRGKSDVVKSITQLILTIGKAKTFDKHLPPPFLAAFDTQKIAFILYNAIHEVFYQNDFNWNIRPSDPKTPEFQQVYNQVKTTLDQNALIFYFGKDDLEIGQFIAQNFKLGQVAHSKIKIDKNNFTIVYSKWLELVKPTILVNWIIAKQNGIIDGDFYLADLLARENETLKEKLYVLLKKSYYELDRKLNDMGMLSSQRTTFADKQKAHKLFWNKYERPPHEDYWDYIVKRRDLLVPQDVRERKGSFFTPKIWVELSQKHITDVLGQDWQDEYFIWDCAAGTGNLLAGLTNKYNIFASTLDKQDVDVMHDRIKNGANLLEDHVFQFDFLNDNFEKLPKSLKAIIDDPVQSKKLVIYINPPYAEATSTRTVMGTGTNKAGVSKGSSKYHTQYKTLIGQAANEVFALFLTRIYEEIPGAKIANFSTLKNLQGSNFRIFRSHFKASLERLFICPAASFDNVKGKFPIGFFIWDTAKTKVFTEIEADIFNKSGTKIGRKYFYGNLSNNINKWLKLSDAEEIDGIGYLTNPGPDFQNNNSLYTQNNKGKRHFNYYNITKCNLFQGSIYFAVRHCIKATWLNDRDQFLAPNPKWQKDTEFQNDCLTYILFHGQNRISAQYGTNHWIPFTEAEVQARSRFESHFMTDFIKGKHKVKQTNGLHDKPSQQVNGRLIFSQAAKAVFEAGKILWLYYHTQPNVAVNASLYDIKAHFQGRNAKGRMNSKSADEHYNKLIGELRTELNSLAQKIQPKVYEYRFLLS